MTGPHQLPAVSTKFRVGKKFVCEMSFGPSGLACEWSPRVPDHLSKKDLRTYRQRRDMLLAEVAALIGAPVGVADGRGCGFVMSVIRPEDAAQAEGRA
ncbi:hypothetical protein DSM21852_00760 [Methylocystis bryophila]|uniref:Uncharacterized protein n=1 Tax=Methylocystis bryophila TaxID=655015 RepID=A0A1W6MTH2_9HYPH|nr:hypothetical protein B1812_07370 [Methylocystis bryophila]BDV36823.1 hypothetical protein DSM21852_00760 [Methylocystis bryophila]